jgi:hypothetical protein
MDDREVRMMEQKMLRRAILAAALLRTDDEDTAVRAACRMEGEIEKATMKEEGR